MNITERERGEIRERERACRPAETEEVDVVEEVGLRLSSFSCLHCWRVRETHGTPNTSEERFPNR
jgi:hypothetical protein